MVAVALKLIPLLQFLLEVFKADDGKLTAKVKAAFLAFVALLIFSAYVSYAYVQQFHALVELKAHQQYLVKSEVDATGRSLRLESRVAALENKLDLCRRGPEPYEGTSPKPMPQPTAPEKAVSVLKETQPVDKRIPSPTPFPKHAQLPVAVIPSREEVEKALSDRMDRISRHINN